MLIVAKQIGPYKITGTIDNICFYQMEGQYYARQKSLLTGKRVKKDPAFAGTMESANLLGKASKLASLIKGSFPKEEQCRELFRILTGKVMRLMREGVDAAEIKMKLSIVLKENELGSSTVVKRVVKKRTVSDYRSVFGIPVLSLSYERKKLFFKSSADFLQRPKLNYSPP
jgi:hypothetical protein